MVVSWVEGNLWTGARVLKPRLIMIATYTGQLILGTDKRNPLFTVYAQEEGAEAQRHVYYGLELLEVVSADRHEPSFKMLVGRLYNAGVSVGVLQQTFQADAKTIQRWGRALRSGNAQELIRVLEGRRRSRKLSPEIQAYVRVRWPDLVSQGLYRIGKRLRQEVRSVFGVTLSQETLRPPDGRVEAASRCQHLAGAAASHNRSGSPAGPPEGY